VINRGDLNGDRIIDLIDIIIGLKLLTDENSGKLYLQADVDGDNKIGLAEILFIFQVVAR